METKPDRTDEEWDLERLQYFMFLSAEEKLHYLEQLNTFLYHAMPPANREIWERLKQEGF